MTYGQLQPAFGFHRLKIVEFFVALIQAKYKCADDALLKLDVVSTCLVNQLSLAVSFLAKTQQDLFFTYEWNNFLHASVEQLLQSILDGVNPELSKSLFTQSNLAKRILDAHAVSEDGTPAPPELLANEVVSGSMCKNGVRRGYMGFLNNITSAVIQAQKESEELQEILNGNNAGIPLLG